MVKATIQSSTPRGNVKVIVTKARTGAGRISKVKFGNVTVQGVQPSSTVVSANVERSSVALERAIKKLIKPGIVLRAKKDVPKFSAIEDEPGVFLRRLNGQEQRGRLVNGAFEVID